MFAYSVDKKWLSTNCDLGADLGDLIRVSVRFLEQFPTLTAESIKTNFTVTA